MEDVTSTLLGTLEDATEDDDLAALEDELGLLPLETSELLLAGLLLVRREDVLDGFDVVLPGIELVFADEVVMA